jgi:hypothetical protein
MKRIIFFISIFVLGINVCAQSTCIRNAADDVTCSDVQNPNITYTTSSVATLAARARVQEMADKHTALEQQQQALNDQALKELIANQITNDSKLSAQQAEITKSLNALPTQTK